MTGRRARTPLGRLAGQSMGLALWALALGGCRDVAPDDSARADARSVPSGGSDANPDVQLAIASWNLEWFGDTEEGPRNEQVQLENAAAVVAAVGADIWGVQEIVSAPQFHTLLSRLPGVDGFLANDPSRVPGGAAWYSSGEQKVGFLFRTGSIEVRKAEVILSASSFEFAGRPPLRVDVTVKADGSPLTIIVLHMKAFANEESYNLRAGASAALKQYLDQSTDRRVVVIGDWNDDVDVSVVRGGGGQLLSPFKNFVDDVGNYEFATSELSAGRQSSTTRFSEMIDHHLVVRDMRADFLAGSAQVVRPTIDSYDLTTSDHYPVVTHFR